MPYCTFKCDKENGTQICHNCSLAAEPKIEVAASDLITIYDNNPKSEAIVFAGL